MPNRSTGRTAESSGDRNPVTYPRNPTVQWAHGPRVRGSKGFNECPLACIRGAPTGHCIPTQSVTLGLGHPKFFGVLKERCIPRNGLGPHWRYAAFLQNAPILQLSIPRVPPWAGMRSPVGAGDDRLDLPSESNGPHVHGPPSTVHRPWFMVHESMRSMNVLWLAFGVPQRGTVYQPRV